MSTPEALRLAAAITAWSPSDPARHIDACRSAAAKLQEQAAEIERLTADHAELLDTCRQHTAEVRGLSEQVAALTAERDALKLITERLQQHNVTTWNAGHTLGLMAGQKALTQAQDALQRDAWGNTQLTEALLAAEAERDALRAMVGTWQGLYRRAINEANGLTNYVEDRPELRSAERRLSAIEAEARAALQQPKEQSNG